MSTTPQTNNSRSDRTYSLIIRDIMELHRSAVLRCDVAEEQELVGMAATLVEKLQDTNAMQAETLRLAVKAIKPVHKHLVA
jgi:hypothetical protein